MLQSWFILSVCPGDYNITNKQTRKHRCSSEVFLLGIRRLCSRCCLRPLQASPPEKLFCGKNLQPDKRISQPEAEALRVCSADASVLVLQTCNTVVDEGFIGREAQTLSQPPTVFSTSTS